MANMGKLEPSVLVIPNLLMEALPIGVEYIQEDVFSEVDDCHGSRERSARIMGAAKVSFGKLKKNSDKKWQQIT